MLIFITYIQLQFKYLSDSTLHSIPFVVGRVRNVFLVDWLFLGRSLVLKFGFLILELVIYFYFFWSNVKAAVTSYRIMNFGFNRRKEGCQFVTKRLIRTFLVEYYGIGVKLFILNLNETTQLISPMYNKFNSWFYKVELRHYNYERRQCFIFWMTQNMKMNMWFLKILKNIKKSSTKMKIDEIKQENVNLEKMIDSIIRFLIFK